MFSRLLSAFSCAVLAAITPSWAASIFWLAAYLVSSSLMRASFSDSFAVLYWRSIWSEVLESPMVARIWPARTSSPTWTLRFWILPLISGLRLTKLSALLLPVFSMNNSSGVSPAVKTVTSLAGCSRRSFSLFSSGLLPHALNVNKVPRRIIAVILRIKVVNDLYFKRKGCDCQSYC